MFVGTFGGVCAYFSGVFPPSLSICSPASVLLPIGAPCTFSPSVPSASNACRCHLRATAVCLLYLLVCSWTDDVSAFSPTTVVALHRRGCVTGDILCAVWRNFLVAALFHAFCVPVPDDIDCVPAEGLRCVVMWTWPHRLPGVLTAAFGHSDFSA